MRHTVALALATILTLTSVPQPASAAEPARLDLELPDAFELDQATVAMGRLALDDARLTNLSAVRVRDLSVPGGTLYVCPAEPGERGEIPPLPVLQERCRDEDAYEDPLLRVGSRTWLASRGNLTLTGPIDATTSVLWQDANLTLRWAGTLPDRSMPFELEDDAFAFRPIRSSSEIRVEDSDDRGSYNGTGWIFYLEASGQLGLRAEGAAASVHEASAIGIERAPLADFKAAYEPRRLLDLQDAVLGPDAREPIHNVTRLFGSYGRIPHLVNGALIGYLDGRVGDQTLTPETVSLVHVETADLKLQEARMTGQADISFTRTTQGFGEGAQSPVDVPWWLVGLLWIAAAALLVLRREGIERPAWHRWLGLGSFLVVFPVWDALFNGLVGTSAIGLLGDEPGLGVLLAVLGFELAALAVAWTLVYLPARLALERGVPTRLAAWARPALTVLGLGAMALSPGTVLVMGQLVARL